MTMILAPERIGFMKFGAGWRKLKVMPNWLMPWMQRNDSPWATEEWLFETPTVWDGKAHQGARC